MIAIILHSGSQEMRNNITQFLADKSMNVWHWIDDLWLIRNPEMTAEFLHKEFVKLYPQFRNHLILMFDFKETGPAQFWGVLGSMQGWMWLGHHLSKEFRQGINKARFHYDDGRIVEKDVYGDEILEFQTLFEYGPDDKVIVRTFKFDPNKQVTKSILDFFESTDLQGQSHIDRST